MLLDCYRNNSHQRSDSDCATQTPAEWDIDVLADNPCLNTYSSGWEYEELCISELCCLNCRMTSKMLLSGLLWGLRLSKDREKEVAIYPVGQFHLITNYWSNFGVWTLQYWFPVKPEGCVRGYWFLHGKVN